MKKHSKRASSRTLAVLLAMALILPTLLGAMPAGATENTGGEITAFAPLGENIGRQSVPNGTAQASLNLPDKLETTVSVLQDSGNEGEPASPSSFSVETVSVPVTWSAEPAFDGDTAGTYVFTAKPGAGFTLANGIEKPTVTVTVEGAKLPLISIVGFDPNPYSRPDDPDTYYIVVDKGTAIADIPLPATLKATIEGGKANAYTVNVDKWECIGVEDDFGKLEAGNYDPQTAGTYRFSPKLLLGENESLADGVKAPAVDVVVTMGMGIAPLANSSTEIDLTGFDFGANVTTYTTWSYTASTRTFAVSGDVSVVGTVTGATQNLTFNIASGKTVKWSADYSGTTTSGSATSTLIDLAGAGTFEVIGGSIADNTAYNYGYALYAPSTIAVVKISGGTVSTTVGYAIYSGGNVEVSGGTVKTTSGGFAIRASLDVTVSGGTVCSTSGSRATFADTTVTGGFVFGRAPSITGQGNVINGTLSLNPGGADNGVVVAWDKASAGESPIYIEGDTTNLIVNPTGKAVWGKNGGQSGIVYTNGTNEGFFPVSGVTVTGSSLTIDLKDYAIGGVTSVQAAINAAFSSNDIVYIVNTGSAFNAAGNTLTLNIPSGNKVEWSAAYRGTSASSPLIKLTGTGAFEVTGGSVTQSGGGAAINAASGGTVKVLGGFVFAYGGGTSDVIQMASGSPTITSPGVVVAWNKGAGTTTYAAGMAKDLTINPTTGATAAWDNHTTLGGGISYANGANTGFFPVSGVTVTGQGDTIDLNDYAIVDDIENGIAHALTQYSTVQVVNTGSTFNASNVLRIDISSGKTVKWGAAYEGDSSIDRYLIHLYGTGTFEIVAGGSITDNNTTDSVRYAIEASSPSSSPVIKVIGGTVSAKVGRAISSYSTVIVNSGTVSAMTNNAIYTSSTGSVTVNGGFVFASSSGGAIGGYNATVTAPGVVVRWANPGGTPTYTAGSSTNLSITATTPEGTAVWGNSGGQGGIAYENGANKGFFAVSGVTVRIDSDTIDLNDYSTVANVQRDIADALLKYNPVKVINSGSAFSAGSNTLTINIPAGKKVEWSAEYVGTSAASSLINLTGTGAFEVKGGFVFAYGTGLSNVISGSPTITAPGVVVAWDEAQGTMTYIEGTNLDLTISSGTTATWHKDATLGGGISYENGANTGFFPISGVTVKTLTDTIDLKDYSSVATIQRDIAAALALSYSTVYIVNTGSAFDAGSNTLTINIPSSKTVEWNAVYAGTS